MFVELIQMENPKGKNPKFFNAPLFEAVLNYSSQKNRFHMPAHFGGESIGDEAGALYSSAAFDITELSFSDNLNNPTGVIKEAQELAAQAYGAKESLFFTAGATSAVFCALAAVRERTKNIAIDLFSHKSAFSAARHLGFTVHIIPREFDGEGFPLPLNPSKLWELLSQNQDIGAVFVTSPDFFGNVCCERELFEVSKMRGALFLVDQSHGAHFCFSPLLPPSAAPFADFAIHSPHKTMPVYTGGAMLHVNCGLSAKSALYRADLHTSSPSYVTMCSLDYARALYQNEGEKMYAELFSDIEKLISENPDYTFFNRASPEHDFSRLVVNADFEELEKQNVYPEMRAGRWSVLIVSPQNQRRLSALNAALKRLKPLAAPPQTFEHPGYPAVLPPYSPDAKTRFVELEKSEGLISAADVGCYPPGVPVLFYGEKITAKKLDFLLKNKSSIFNFMSDKICVIMD
jgi:arginine/lysine/ornithine decarboxylase